MGVARPVRNIPAVRVVTDLQPAQSPGQLPPWPYHITRRRPTPLHWSGTVSSRCSAARQIGFYGGDWELASARPVKMCCRAEPSGSPGRPSCNKPQAEAASAPSQSSSEQCPVVSVTKERICSKAALCERADRKR